MGWESRGGNLYYYRAKRVGGKVRRQYHGTGFRALLAVEQDEAERTERDERRRVVTDELATIASLEATLSAFDAAAEALVRGALLVTGHHRHDRGAWRRRRGED